MKKDQQSVYSIFLKIKEVLNKNPDYKDIVLPSTLLAKAIKADNLNAIDIYRTGKEYNSLEDAILDKVSELDADISEEEQEIIDKYNLLQFDKEELKLEEKPKETKKEEKKEVKKKEIKEEVKEVKKKEIKEEVKEEKSKVQLVKRYTVNSLIQLNKAKIYVSANDEKEFTTLTGRFYIYNKNIVNGRIKISKYPKDKITGWVNLKDIKVVKR